MLFSPADEIGIRYSHESIYMIRIIIAVDQGNAIGWSDGDLAYTGLKQDMKRFKELTTGGTVVMGFNTFKSLKRPNGLPNRRNIVLTSKSPSETEGIFGPNVEVVSSLDWLQAHQTNGGWATEDLWIIGGKSIYEQALRLDMVDEMYITLIHASCEADVVLDIDLATWKLFVLRNRQWVPTVETSQWDGDFQTTYLHLKKQSA